MKIDQIKQRIKECDNYIDKLIEHYSRDTTTKVSISNHPFGDLKKLISTTDINVAIELENATRSLLTKYGTISIIAVGRICAVLNILSHKYNNIEKSYKIFISHSSKDKDIIKQFVEKILRLGCAIEESDIFCTSIESMSIKTGEDLRQHIKNHIILSDYVFLMISKNYIKSTICLNEMGAPWILDKKVKPLLFPPLKHNAIWLSEILKNSPINGSGTLDNLHDELISEYPPRTNKTSDWNEQKKDFIAYINQSAT